MNKKYNALRLISGLYKLVGGLIAAGTILLVVLYIIGSAGLNTAYGYIGYGNSLWLILINLAIIFIPGGLLALSSWAFGELIELLIELGHNTRTTTEMLQMQYRIMEHQLRYQKGKQADTGNQSSRTSLLRRELE